MKVEYNNYLLQPFVRLAGFSQPEYNTPDIGIGLCLVNVIARVYGGSLVIKDLDYDADKNEISYVNEHRVQVELKLPVESEIS